MIFRIKDFLVKSNIIVAFFVFFAAALLPNLFTLFFPLIYENSTVDAFSGYSRVTVFLMVVVILPVFETLVFQTTIISVVNRLIQRKERAFVVSLLLSSLLFALHHFHSLCYLFLGFYAGGIFVIAYYFAKERMINSTFFVFCIHAVYNMFVFFVNG